MIEAWLKEFIGLFLYFFGRATPNETYVLIALCVLLGALALSRISRRLGSIGAFYTTGILLVCLGVTIIIASLACLPFLPVQAWWMVLALPAVMLLIVVLPLTMLFQKGGYVTALIAWTVTLLVVAAVLTLEPMAKQSIDNGIEKAVQKGMPFEKHRIETENFK